MNTIYTRQRLTCSKCTAPLSKPVLFSHIRRVDFQCELKESPSLSGIAKFIYEDRWHKKQPRNLWNLSVLRVWMNRNDILSNVKSTLDLRMLGTAKFQSGCCGINGWLSGPNMACMCKEIVGTEFSDCETFDAFVPDIEVTTWRVV